MWQPNPVSKIEFTGKSADGEFLEFIDDEGNLYRSKINESIRSALSDRKLSAVREEVATFSVKEIQARLEGRGKFRRSFKNFRFAH